MRELFVSVCSCTIEYQNIHSKRIEDIFAGPRNLKVLVEGLRLGFMIEIRIEFKLGFR